MAEWRECRRYAKDFEDHSRACHLPGHRRVVGPETCAACPVPALVATVEAVGDRCREAEAASDSWVDAKALETIREIVDAALALLPAEGERGEGDE